jgi:RNA polymerase sigma-70 factor (ECF subfamily)
MRKSGEMAEPLGGYNAGVITDAAAVERTLAGEREAYRVLVQRHSNYVYRLAYRMTGNPHDAEEVVQEAFLRAYQKLQQFAGNANFATWVYRIAANYAIDRLRNRSRSTEPDQRFSSITGAAGRKCANGGTHERGVAGTDSRGTHRDRDAALGRLRN